MHMKIPDPYAAWMRRLLIVEVVCFLMLFSLGCAGKTAEDAQEAFPFETVQLTSEYGTLYIQVSSYSEKIGSEILQKFNTDVKNAVAEQKFQCVLQIQRLQATTRMLTNGIARFKRCRAALTERDF